MSSTNTARRIAVIGCGYVGSAVGEALVEAGHDVVGTTTTARRLDELCTLGIRPEVVEVADVQRLHRVLADREAIFLTIAPRQRGEGYREVYLAGVRHLLAAVKDTTVRRIIYTSSTRVYGQNDGSWVDESSTTAPRDEKGRILLEAERTLLHGAPQLGTKVADAGADDVETLRGPQTHGLQSVACKPAARGNEQKICATVVRLSGIYGPGRDVAARVRGLAGTERTDGDAYVNLIHLDDIVVALIALLRVAFHGVLNLTDDQPERRRDFYDRVIAAAHLPPIRWVRGDTPPKLGKRVGNDLIKRVLDLTLKHPTH
jgi:nucleoside-diphosphate-sugar epimerase